MEDSILIGHGDRISRVSSDEFRAHLAGAPRFFGEKLAFMTRGHHAVRNHIVAELPRSSGRPLMPSDISRRLGTPPAQIDRILDDLERNLFFIVRNDMGGVHWAYPVTVDVTPHRLKFDSGECVQAA